MKVNKVIILVTLACAALLNLGFSDSIFAQAKPAKPAAQAQQKMTKEQYRAELAQLQAREREAKSKLAECEKESAALKAQVAELDKQIAALREEIYRLLGYTQEEIDAFQKELEQIRDQINGLLRLSPEELYTRLAEVDKIGARLEEMAKDKRAKLPDIARLLSEDMELYQKLKEAAARAKPKYEIYTVVRHDCLWNIAKKPDIYKDPFQWMRIYTVNRDQIKNPDLIYPKQNFKIQRQVEKGQYLVKRGDSLKKIAGLPEVYSDPMQWKKIYEANTDVLKSPNKVYEGQTLKIPGATHPAQSQVPNAETQNLK